MNNFILYIELTLHRFFYMINVYDFIMLRFFSLGYVF